MTRERRSPAASFRKGISLLLVFLTLGGVTPGVMAQAADQPPAEDEATQLDPDEPVPYDPTEFAPWMRDLRRGEIIAVGAFPIAMIVSGIGYQVGRFAIESIERGEPAMDVAPFFFSTSSDPTYDSTERLGLVVSGAVISVLVAVADWLIGRADGE